MSNFKFWITIDNNEPTLHDFSRARAKLYDLGIDDSYKIGILLNMTQWTNFLIILSKFESRFVSAIPGIPKEIMGFPVRLIKDL